MTIIDRIYLNPSNEYHPPFYYLAMKHTNPEQDADIIRWKRGTAPILIWGYITKC